MPFIGDLSSFLRNVYTVYSQSEYSSDNKTHLVTDAFPPPIDKKNASQLVGFGETLGRSNSYNIYSNLIPLIRASALVRTKVAPVEQGKVHT